MDWLNESQDVVKFGYDAVEDTGRRKSPSRVVASEDKHLRRNNRKTLNASARDCRRNFVVTRWAINKHIDFVVDHKFQPNTGNKAFDKELAEFFQQASKAENFDISGRHSLRAFMRLAEAARIVDGDFFAVRQRGGFLQAIESDRVRDPEGVDSYGRYMGDVGTEESPWTEGVKTNNYGRPQLYAIHRRTGHSNQFEHERNVSARKVIPLGFYDRFDQVRGVSPLASVINSLKDLYESYDYALAKSKVAQLFALSIQREQDWGADNDDGSMANDREVRFDKGPQLLDLEPGEEAKFLSTNTPGEETAAFWQEMTGLVLKSLNIPYSFFQENHTNFFGSRSALILYLRAVQKDRDAVTGFMNDWLCWRLKVGQLKGEIKMPADFECDPKNWMWIPTGIQYWDPSKEITADAKAIQLGLRTREEIRAERFGDDWHTVVYPKLKVEEEMMRELQPEPEFVPPQGKPGEPAKPNKPGEPVKPTNQPKSDKAKDKKDESKEPSK